MAIEKESKWIRSPGFKKYFASSFGVSKSGNFLRLDFGDEKVKFDEKDVANVSECQIIVDKKSFEVLLNLLKNFWKEEKSKK